MTAVPSAGPIPDTLPAASHLQRLPEIHVLTWPHSRTLRTALTMASSLRPHRAREMGTFCSMRPPGPGQGSWVRSCTSSLHPSPWAEAPDGSELSTDSCFYLQFGIGVALR